MGQHAQHRHLVRPRARHLLAALMAAAVLGAVPAPAAECKLALALALDISSSVNDREYRLQLQGLAAAFRNPEVIEAALTPEGKAVAVTVYEWSGYRQQQVVEGWTLLDGEAAMLAFSDRLGRHARPHADQATALGKAVQFGARLMQGAPACARRVIDVSGDGTNNDGVGPGYFRARGELAGITVNGLVIRGADPDPLPYYLSEVAQGPDAFVEVAEDYGDYARAIARKLLREIGREMVLGDAR